MPLTATIVRAVPDDDRKAVGIWMENDNSQIRVFVTYEALWQIDPSCVRDVASALSIFDANRARLENLASARYDASGADEDGKYEGQPILILRTDDIT
ncbi:MAG: DUF1488 family protein [Xanthobacteraceae bacterium]